MADIPAMLDSNMKYNDGAHTNGSKKATNPPQVSADTLGKVTAVIKSSTVFLLLQQTFSTMFPWLCSIEAFNDSFNQAVQSVRERPITSILFGMVALFGFVPFLGFVLIICGSFAFLFTAFIFCQSVTVLVSAVVCASMFCGMLFAIAMLSLLLGGAVHSLKLWGIITRHAGNLFFNLSVTALRRLGVPEADLPVPPPAD